MEEDPTRHSASPWSTQVLSVEPESTKAWSTFFIPGQVFTAQSRTSGGIFCVDRRWAVYSISLSDFSASPIEMGSPVPSDDPSRCSHAILDGSEKFLLLLSDDYRKLYRFELDRGQWSTVNINGPHPLERDWESLTICSSTLYLFGGLVAFSPTKSQHVNELWKLDIDSGQAARWEQVNPIGSNVPRPRASHHFVSNGHNMFLYGGWDGTYVTDSWEYNPQNNIWTELSPIGSESAAVSRHALLADGIIFSLGDGRFPFSGLAALRATTDRDWFDLQHLSLALHDHFASNALSGAANVHFIASDSGRIFVFEKERGRRFEDIITIYILDTRLVIDPNSSRPVLSHAVTPEPNERLSDDVPSEPEVKPPASEVKPDVLSLVKLCIISGDFHLIEIPDSAAGEGGFCDVFIGVYVPTGTRLALKRPRLSTLNAVDTLRRVQREVEMWSAFDHPNVLPFLGMMAIEPHTYLASPWLEHGDLASFVSDRAVYFKEEEKGTIPRDPKHDAYHAFDERQAIHGIASGIAYLHSLSFVHGDLKGKNVLLGEDNCPLLCDFGMTKALDSPSGSNTSTTMKGVGTLRWQSPELFMNESKTSKSDVYAFGMIIAEVLTGSYPLPALTDFTFLNQVVNKNVRPSFDPASRNDVDFMPLWEIAAGCWVEDPKDRPSMDEVVERLAPISVKG